MKFNLSDTIAKRLDDIHRIDFTPSEYDEEVLFAKRKVARVHKIFRRYAKRQLQITELQGKTINEIKDEAIKLDFPSFSREYLIYINKVKYTKVAEEGELEANTYKLFPRADGIYINYTPKTNDDTLECFYEGLPEADDFDNPDTEPILSSNYDEEIISNAIIRLCEIGFARFKEIKQDKYKQLCAYYLKKVSKEEIISNNSDILECPKIEIHQYI